jgi:hypothetical protein
MTPDELEAAIRVGKPGVRIFVALELLEETAEQKIRDLEAEALRTIRQKNLEKGHACLEKIDGVRELLDSLKLVAGSMIGRQRGLVLDKPHTPVADRIAEIRKSKKRGAA